MHKHCLSFTFDIDELRSARIEIDFDSPAYDKNRIKFWTIVLNFAIVTEFVNFIEIPFGFQIHQEAENRNQASSPKRMFSIKSECMRPLIAWIGFIGTSERGRVLHVEEQAIE